MELLMLLNQLFWKIRREGLLAIEGDVEEPEKSTIFNRFKTVVSNHHAMSFICDNFRVIITTNMAPHELEALLDVDLESTHEDSLIPAASINKVGDALPGLGIVAAVLGVVITMGKISEPPDVLGHSIGAALVGTFLGVLACYGFVGPMATNLEHKARDHGIYFNVIKSALVSFVGGAAPQIAVESGRRAIPGSERPSFARGRRGDEEVEGQNIIIKKVKKGGHGGHHGGSWKVAYADFVTAMMAFFLLLWLISMVAPEKRARVSNYFKHFSIFEKSGTTMLDCRQTRGHDLPSSKRKVHRKRFKNLRSLSRPKLRQQPTRKPRTNSSTS